MSAPNVGTSWLGLRIVLKMVYCEILHSDMYIWLYYHIVCHIA